MQTTGAGIFVISGLIISFLGSPSKFTTEIGIFGVMMMDVVDGDLEGHMDSIEREILQNAMTKYRWNKTAAKALGVSFRSLRYRLKKLGLED